MHLRTPIHHYHLLFDVNVMIPQQQNHRSIVSATFRKSYFEILLSVPWAMASNTIGIKAIGYFYTKLISRVEEVLLLHQLIKI